MNIGKIAFLAGLVIAVVLAFIGIPYAGIILLVLGLIIGFLNITDAEAQTFLIAAIALLATNAAGSIAGIPLIGMYVVSILNNIGVLMAPAVIVVAVKSLLATASN